MHRMLRTIVYTLVVTLSASIAMGKVATGTYNYGTFDNKGFDTINVGNLNVHANFPVLNKAGRGLSFYYNLSYDSSVWSQATVSGSTSWSPVFNFGWQSQTDGPLGYLTYDSLSAQCSGDNGPETYSYRTNYVYSDQFGGSHEFPNLTILIGADKWGCSGLTHSGTDVAYDGTGYSISATETTATITTRAGGSIVPPIGSATASGSVVDSNGNKISADGSGHFTDTSGKVALEPVINFVRLFSRV